MCATTRPSSSGSCATSASATSRPSRAKQAIAATVGERLGVDRVYAEQSPEQKVEVVRAACARQELRSVVMVGDAPALAAADVGIAMGSAGATVSSETADAVVLVDRVDRVAAAIGIGRRSLHLARQSVLVGLGLSFAAVKTVDRPRVRAIPELLGSCPLPRGQVKEAAKRLPGHDAALIVLGEPTIDQGVERAMTRAVNVAAQGFDDSPDVLGTTLSGAFGR